MVTQQTYRDDFVRGLGLLALGSRLRRLSDRIMADGVEIYRSANVAFEPRWFPLFRLLADEGPTSVGEASRRLGLTHAAVSQTASAMSKRGLVRSQRDRGDERRRVLSLTAKGRELLPRLSDTWDDISAGVRDAAAAGGLDVMAAVEALEHAFAEASLAQRAQEHRRQRQFDEVEIVDFEPRYAKDFKRLNLEWLERYFEVEPIDHEVLGRPKRKIIDPGGHVFFARVDATIVGTCALIRVDERFELSKMAVTEGYRGRQIGKRLLTHAIDVAHAAGAPSIFLITNSSLVPAVNLYRRFGFVVTRAGAHPKYARGDLTMELALREPRGSAIGSK